MDISRFQPPLADLNTHVWRIVPSRFPPTSIFDRIADTADIDAVFEIEGRTNDRLREEAGLISLVPPDDRVSGPGTTPIMAAFTHINDKGARFSDSTYGAYYAAFEVITAVEETKHHRQIFLAATHEAPIDIDMRVYRAWLTASAHDVRGGTPAEIYHPGNYSVSQRFAARLRREGSNGLIYDSVRHAGGTCVAVFRPRLLCDCCQERHLTYRWDGTRITDVYEKRSFNF